MTTFNRKPTPEEFDAGGASKPAQLPALDPKAEPKRGYNLRLNDYELAELERMAKEDDTSMQRLMRRVLRNYIRNRNGTKKAS